MPIMKAPWVAGLILLFTGTLQAQLGFSPEASAYMDQARQAMEQRTAGDPAFHVKATFTSKELDGKGKIAEQAGTYEETWMSPMQWRRDISLGAEHYASGRNEGKVWRTPQSPSFAVTMMQDCIEPRIPPLPDLLQPQGLKPKPWQLDRVELNGIMLDRVGSAENLPKHGKRIAPDYAYYFLPESHALLLKSMGEGGLQFSKSAKLGDKLFLMGGNWSFGPDLNGSFTVDALEANPKPDANFAGVPAGAIESPVSAPGTSTKGARKIGGDDPRYPTVAKSAHVQGHVRIAAQVGEDGRIIGVRVVSGPPLLRQAALDAVRTWRYDPVTIDGIPVSVVTEIDINFSFGPG